MVKCSIPKTLTMAYFTVSEDLLFYACPLPLSERKKLDAYLLLLEKSSAGKYLKQINFDSEPGRPKIDQCRLFCCGSILLLPLVKPLSGNGDGLLHGSKNHLLNRGRPAKCSEFLSVRHKFNSKYACYFCDNNEAHLFPNAGKIWTRSIWTEANLKPTLTSTNLFGNPRLFIFD